MSAVDESPAGKGASERQTVRGAAKEIGDEARREGARLKDEALAGAQRQVDDRKHATGDYLHTVASAIGSGAEVFRRDGMDGTGSMLDRAAAEIDGVADRLAERRPEEIIRDVEGFARRHPAVFFGSAFLLAFGAARLLKSTAPDGSATRGDTPPNHGGML